VLAATIAASIKKHQIGTSAHLASEVDLVLVAAQNRPLDHLAGDRIADTFFYVACLYQLAPARQRDRYLDGGEFWRW
jgi:hypothetical protein